MALAIPTESDRRGLYRLIRQYSSWTAWAHVGRYHKVFIDLLNLAFKDTQERTPAGAEPLIDAGDMALFLNGYASFQGALAKLRTGDKSVFKFIDYGVPGAPTFWEANRIINTWAEGFLGGLFGARGMIMPVETHPLFPRIEAALSDVTESWSYLGISLQTRHTDLPATIETMTRTDSRGISCGTQLDYSTLPPSTELPDPPMPVAEVLIETGRDCPFYGIWEPVKLDRPTGFLAAISRPKAPENRRYTLDGCMNYLHQGSPAPTIAFEGDAPRGEGRPTVWRLIWKDDRYLDGLLPAEEASYRFTKFKAVPKVPQAVWTRPEPSLVWLPTGTAVPQAGLWAAQTDLNLRVALKQGEPLPALPDGYNTVWVFVAAS